MRFFKTKRKRLYENQLKKVNKLSSEIKVTNNALTLLKNERLKALELSLKVGIDVSSTIKLIDSNIENVERKLVELRKEFEVLPNK